MVFATETMALGIHMPARSVILQGLTKRSERGFRTLSHNELTQMAGRAGRRGIDSEGQCVIALDVRDGVEDILRVVDGAPEPIESQFKLGYGSVAVLLGPGAPPEALRRRIEASFGQYQNLKRIRDVEHDVARLESAREEAQRYEAPCGHFERIGRYRQSRLEVEQHRQALGRGARRGERGPLEAEAGRLALVRRKGGPTLALILGSSLDPWPPGHRRCAVAARCGHPRQSWSDQADLLGHAPPAPSARSGAGRVADCGTSPRLSPSSQCRS